MNDNMNQSVGCGDSLASGEVSEAQFRTVRIGFGAVGQVDPPPQIGDRWLSLYLEDGKTVVGVGITTKQIDQLADVIAGFKANPTTFSGGVSLGSFSFADFLDATVK